MSSENYVGIIMAENLRFLGEGSSAQGPPKLLSIVTHGDSWSWPLVAPGERTPSEVDPAMLCGEKSDVD